MRHLRAMRSALTPAGSFLLGVGDTIHGPNKNQGRSSPPKASGVDLDPGSTPPSSSASLGEGSSSLLPLGQQTPPSLPPQEENREMEAGVASENPAAGASDDAVASYRSPPAVAASPSGHGRDDQGRKHVPRSEGNDGSSLVHLRGSPSGQSKARTTPISAVGEQGQQRALPLPPPHSPTSPIGATAADSVTLGVAAGVAAGAATSGKRRRPTAAGASQRLVTRRAHDVSPRQP